MATKERRVIVTGAGSGLGWAVAHRFVEEGTDIVVADVSTSSGVDSVFAAVGDRLDVLCNNAGILDALRFVDETSDEWFDKVIATNLRGPFTMSHRAVPLMASNGGGIIINTASVCGLRGGRAGAAYTASKFGLVGLTYNIAATVRDKGIRCNAVCPGGMLTQIGSDQDVSMAGYELVQGNERVPSVEADVVAKVVMFLASDAAAHINGVALPVDGGSISA
jgi:NAD(P)-dependent dehydrogenase (short-subunit alcohol dehydrogenase family)